MVPPAADALHRELAGVVADADADPVEVVCDGTDSARRGLARFLSQEVVDLDHLRSALRLPGSAVVLEAAHILLLLRVDRDKQARRLQVPDRAGGSDSSTVAKQKWLPFPSIDGLVARALPAQGDGSVEWARSAQLQGLV